MVIECPNCGAKNSIPDTLVADRKYGCARCNTRFNHALAAQDTESQERARTKTSGVPRTGKLKTIGRGARKLLPVLYPLLFAASPILTLYAGNVAEVDPSETIIPLLVSFCLTLVLLLIVKRLLKNTMKAAIIVSTFLLLFFYYGVILSAFGGWNTYSVPHPTTWIAVTALCIIVLVLVAYFTRRTRSDLAHLNVIITVVAATIVLIPSATLVANETSFALQDSGMSRVTELNSLDSSNAGYLPDIYYIVLDRYASASTLMEFYDFDNSEFLESLSGQGFYVASESTANYLKTRSSLASSLNMEYINYLSEELGEDFMDRSPIFSMLQDHNLQRLLTSAGYEFIHFGSWWGPTRVNPYADRNHSYSQMPYFSMFAFESTLAYPASVATHIADDRNSRHRESALYTLEHLAEIPDIEKPTFVFAHILLPHPPYVFDSDGGHVALEETGGASAKADYINQLIFANSRIQQLIEGILLESEYPPIIILQADEGPFPPGTESQNYNWERATEARLRHKMRILNAYYLPGIDPSILYPSITPVNSFRVILNSYFNANLELLPDRSYVLRGGDPYRFIDITNAIDYD